VKCHLGEESSRPFQGSSTRLVFARTAFVRLVRALGRVVVDAWSVDHGSTLVSSIDSCRLEVASMVYAGEKEPVATQPSGSCGGQ